MEFYLKLCCTCTYILSGWHASRRAKTAPPGSFAGRLIVVTVNRDNTKVKKVYFLAKHHDKKSKPSPKL
ncbi:MAG: hypothetical protein Q8N79_06455 [Candidatus Methanoperedens sp.]|nr:hypothetical protein [Candidatus Methanoperedens sp.]